METCQYKNVNTSFSDSGVSKWKPFLRQSLISSGVLMTFFIFGLCSGAPTVIIPQLRREANSTAAVSNEMASWMSSIYGYASIPWIIILPLLTERFGRKLPFLIVAIGGLCGFIVFYCSNTATSILIGEAMHGILPACTITINIIIITEYSSPKYRGIFLTLKTATFAWGIWAAQAIGTFFHWKIIALIGIIGASLSILSVLFWPESPYWLASKACFEKCSASHRWLKGTDDNSEKELAELIESQKIGFNKVENTNNIIGKMIFSRNFCKPVSICIVALSLYHLSGKLVCAIYAVDIIKKITGDESTAYTGMLILDGVTVLGMYVGCMLSKFFKRRTILLTGSFIGIWFLYMMSLYFYLIKLSVITENNIVTISFLSIFSMAISCGPLLMSTSIYGELIPLQFRSFAILFLGLFNNILMATMLKIAPFLFQNFKIYGTFLFYGVMSTICTIILYKYLPETKDKTLKEIEDVVLKSKKEEDKELMFLERGNYNVK